MPLPLPESQEVTGATVTRLTGEALSLDAGRAQSLLALLREAYAFEPAQRDEAVQAADWQHGGWRLVFQTAQGEQTFYLLRVMGGSRLGMILRPAGEAGEAAPYPAYHLTGDSALTIELQVEELYLMAARNHADDGVEELYPGNE